uniref:Uncharacterized protein n=1 Tax=Sexangularia sp. CB-2014 TaxID=1486929 RepID=A0A7S1Y940_9EUKA|mmetsp:Transcript_12640/g.39934  ORF Transcript_12640/g.39934 Transcript_12640/m.39934 type:complete len:244 (+) Transcript_12640:94-825(+)
MSDSEIELDLADLEDLDDELAEMAQGEDEVKLGWVGDEGGEAWHKWQEAQAKGEKILMPLLLRLSAQREKNAVAADRALRLEYEAAVRAAEGDEQDDRNRTRRRKRKWTAPKEAAIPILPTMDELRALADTAAPRRVGADGGEGASAATGLQTELDLVQHERRLARAGEHALATPGGAVVSADDRKRLLAALGTRTERRHGRRREPKLPSVNVSEERYQRAVERTYGERAAPIRAALDKGTAL